MAGQELKYDYDKDGDEDINDINYITQRNRNLPSELGQYKTTGGTATAGLSAAVTGLALTGAAVAGTGVGIVPGLILVGLSAGIGWFAGSGAGEQNWKEAVEKEKANLTATLKDKYQFTDTEVTTYLKTIDILADVDTKTGGAVSKNISIANTILQEARNVNSITGEGDAFNKISEMGFGEAFSAGIEGIFGKSEADYVTETRTNLKKLIADNGLNINIDNVPDDKLLDTVNAGLNRYLNAWGAYEFPKAKINYQLTPEQQKAIDDNYAVSVNRIAPVEMGMSPAGTTTAASAGKAAASSAVGVPTTINNGDGTTSTTTRNQDGTVTLIKKDANGVELSREELTEVEAAKRKLIPSPFDNTSGTKSASDYVGLDSGATKVYALDENGVPQEVEPTYTYGELSSFWNTMTETDRIALKKRLYASGYYGASDIYSAMSGNITDVDNKVLEAAMGDANRNGQDLTTYTQPKYETFLLTGRPTGDAAKDLNGDGITDETVSGALQSFFTRNGLKVTDNYIKTFEQQIVSGNMTLEEAMSQIREKLVAPAYPAWSDYIKNGMDIADIASPYIQTIASTLGLPPDAITMNDPLIKKALSGAGADGKPSYTSLYDLDKMIRQDARWENTDEAQKEYADYAQTILQQFGFM
jgi:hypothetical protein